MPKIRRIVEFNKGFFMMGELLQMSMNFFTTCVISILN